jgi:hypothetical protein
MEGNKRRRNEKEARGGREKSKPWKKEERTNEGM